jgi:hypothetical protein
MIYFDYSPFRPDKIDLHAKGLFKYGLCQSSVVGIIF